jgi:hypothetical protein
MKKLRLTFFSVILSLASAHVLAAEIPDSVVGTYKRKQPVCFYELNEKGERKNRCESYAYDTIEIKRKSLAAAYVGITLVFQNEDKCHFYGVGEWDGESIRASAKSNVGTLCKVKISFASDGAASTSTENEECGLAKGFCAYHGVLGGAGPLPKVK